MSDQPEAGDGQRLRPISRSSAKRIRNLNTVAINQMVDGRDRALKEAAEELQLTRQKLANALALLEAVVRRYGSQVFDRETVQTECGRGQVQFDVTENRIGIRLRDRPVSLESLDTR